MCLSRSRAWVGVRLCPVAWALLDPGKVGWGWEWGPNPLTLQISPVGLVQGARDGLVEAHAGWAQAPEVRWHCPLTPLTSAPAVILQLSWGLRALAL